MWKDRNTKFGPVYFQYAVGTWACKESQGFGLREHLQPNGGLGSEVFAVETSNLSFLCVQKQGMWLACPAQSCSGDSDTVPRCTVVLPATSRGLWVGAGLAKLDPRSIPVNFE